MMERVLQVALLCFMCLHATAQAQCTNGNVRLSGTTSGFVEVCRMQQWRAVCNDGQWDDNDAKVVCRQLGLPHTGAIEDANLDTDTIITTYENMFIKKVMCDGDENRLVDCSKMFGGCSNGVAKANCQNANCIHGDIRLRGEHGTTTARSGGVEVCVDSSWRTVCNFEAWNSNMDRTENAKVACRQLGYSKQGAINQAIDENAITSISTTPQGIRQGMMCTGSELQLIDCPINGNHMMCGAGAKLTCQLETCETKIRLRGGRTDTEGRVEVCRNGQWGTVCDDSWDRNDTSVVCRQLGLSNFNAVAVHRSYFGAGSGKIHLSNIQCTGSEDALSDCTFSTEHQCLHNQDASIICQLNAVQCSNEEIRIEYDSEVKRLEFCSNQIWNVCIETSCNDMNVTQLGAHFCGSGEIIHFLTNGSQLYECPISGAGEFLNCAPTTQTVATLSGNCQQVLQDLELQANSDSITVTWGNAEIAQYFDNTSDYEITCSPKDSDLKYSITANLTTREVTLENLPHSTTYECCVTLHIGRYSTRACNRTTTQADESAAPDAIQGTGLWAIIALGVLVAVLVLLLVLVTGACLYLLMSTKKNMDRNASPTSKQERYFENPNNTSHELPSLTPPPSTPHTRTLPPTVPPPYSLTHHFPTKETVQLKAGFNNSEYSVIKSSEPEVNYAVVDKKAINKEKETKMPTDEVPFPTGETKLEGGLHSEYSVIKSSEPELVYAVVDKKAKKKNREAKMPMYEVPNVSREQEWAPEEHSQLQH